MYIDVHIYIISFSEEPQLCHKKTKDWGKKEVGKGEGETFVEDSHNLKNKVLERKWKMPLA